MRKLLERKTSLGKYIPQVDGLRFIAIMSVVLMHLSERIRKYNPFYEEEQFDNYFEFLLSRGTVGVFLFFSISGFILGLPFAKNIINQKPTKSYRSYIIKRFRRIEPPYIFWMSIFFIVILLTGQYDFSTAGIHYLVSVFYLHNLVFESYSTINPVAWSLEVELQFYLMAPLLAKTIYSIKTSLSRILMLALTIIMYPVLESLIGLHQMPYKATLLGSLDFFLIGFLVLEIYLNHRKWLDKKSTSWDIISMLSLFTMFNTYSTSIWLGLVLNCSIFLLFLGGFKGNYTSRILSFKWISIIGGMCYTIYLIHLPLMELIGSQLILGTAQANFLMVFLGYSLITLPILLFISIISYVLIEKPFMTKFTPSYYQNLFNEVYEKIANMKFNNLEKIGSKLTLIIFLFFSSSILLGQNAEDLELLKIDLNNKSSIQLLPLSEMTALAEANSALLQSTQFSKENLDLELKQIKLKWTEYINASASYIYGTSSYLDQSETAFAVDYSTLNRKSIFYHAGITIRIPLSEVLTRGYKSKKIMNERKIVDLQSQEAVAQLRKQVIHYYNQYQNKLDILNIKNDKLQSIQLSTDFAEEALINGKIDVVEYNRIISSQSQTQEEISKTKSEILLAYIMLCELTGHNIRL